MLCPGVVARTTVTAVQLRTMISPGLVGIQSIEAAGLFRGLNGNVEGVMRTPLLFFNSAPVRGCVQLVAQWDVK